MSRKIPASSARERGKTHIGRIHPQKNRRFRSDSRRGVVRDVQPGGVVHRSPRRPAHLDPPKQGAVDPGAHPDRQSRCPA
ncbi:hypothetical protein CJ026_026360, partial [Ralstonia pickettii]